MIYQDTYKFMLRRLSAKEIDVVLELVNQVDWESKVRVDVYQLAKDVGTTVRYTKEVLKKLSSDTRGKKVLEKVGKNTYIFLKGKSSILHSPGDIYGQKYTFLYSKEFQGLSVYGKRIILKASMNFSINKQRSSYLLFSDLVSRNELNSALIADKRELKKELDNIRDVFKGTIKIGQVTILDRRQEAIYIEVTPEMVTDVKYNYTERAYVRENLIENGFAGRLEKEYSIELEKTGKHIFTYMVKHQKGRDYRGDYFREIVENAREIYEESIKRLAYRLQSLIDKGETAGAVSAYFSSVLFSVIAERVTRYKNQKGSILEVLKRFVGIEREEEYKERLHNQDILTGILEEWVYGWLQVRVKKNEKNWQKNQKGKERNKKVETYIQDVIQELEEKLKGVTLKGNNFGKQWIQLFKKDVESYIGIQNNRMEKGWI